MSKPQTMARSLYGLLMLLFLGSCQESTDRAKSERGSTASLTAPCKKSQNSLALAATPPSTARQWMVSELTQDLPPGIAVEMMAADVQSVNGAESEHIDFRYTFAGTPLCNHLVTGHVVHDQLYFANRLPFDSLTTGPERWAQMIEGLSWDSTFAKIRQQTSMNKESFTALHHQRCFFQSGEGVVPMFEVQGLVDERPYFLLADHDGIKLQEPRSFDAKGTMKIYRDNPDTKELIDIEVDNLTAANKLGNGNFQTVIPDNFRPAIGRNSEFFFDPTDERFAEVSAFTNAELMLKWLQRSPNQYDFDCAPVEIHLHKILEKGGRNNAEYVAAAFSPSGRPTIRLGNGDGKAFQNLALDFDVVAHELGHHVVFRRLKSQNGESGVLHEGLADFLVYAKTRHPCLAGSICVPGGSGCLQNQCLRSADNQLSLTDFKVFDESNVHAASQVVSALLWDLTQSGDLGAKGMGILTLKAIAYLQARSGFKDLVNALMMADLEINRGDHACEIFAAAERRGFGAYLDGVDCRDLVN